MWRFKLYLGKFNLPNAKRTFWSKKELVNKSLPFQKMLFQNSISKSFLPNCKNFSLLTENPLCVIITYIYAGDGTYCSPRFRNLEEISR